MTCSASADRISRTPRAGRATPDGTLSSTLTAAQGNVTRRRDERIEPRATPTSPPPLRPRRVLSGRVARRAAAVLGDRKTGAPRTGNPPPPASLILPVLHTDHLIPLGWVAAARPPPRKRGSSPGRARFRVPG